MSEILNPISAFQKSGAFGVSATRPLGVVGSFKVSPYHHYHRIWFVSYGADTLEWTGEIAFLSANEPVLTLPVWNGNSAAAASVGFGVYSNYTQFESTVPQQPFLNALIFRTETPGKNLLALPFTVVSQADSVAFSFTKIIGAGQGKIAFALFSSEIALQ